MVCKLCIFQTYLETREVIEFEDIFGFYIITEASLATISNSFNANLVYKLSITFSKCQDTQALLMLENIWY